MLLSRVVFGGSQASDPLSFMHPPLVVPDALRLSGLAALSGVPLQSSGQALPSVAGSMPSQPQQQQQQQPSRPAAAAPPDAPPMSGSHDGVRAIAGGVENGTPAPPPATRRSAEQPAAPEREAKRKRAAEQRPAAHSQEQQQQDEPSTMAARADVPLGGLEALQGSGAVASGGR